MQAQHKIDPPYQPVQSILYTGKSRNLSRTQTYPEVSLFLSPVEQCQLNKLKEQYRVKFHYPKVALDIFVSVLISNHLKGQKADKMSGEKISPLAIISNLSDLNYHYTADLTAKLATLNKPLQDITLGEPAHRPVDTLVMKLGIF